MSLGDDLKSEVGAIFRNLWTQRDGYTVPESSDLALGNDAVKLDATVLYADLADSTRLVDTETASFAAEVYKAFLHCAAKIIRSEGGEITAYDGDRVMAVFLGRAKNTSAARAALKINWARENVINPGITSVYSTKTYRVKHVTAVDTSRVFVARTGIRGANDLVWVGRAANHAAKMAALPSDYASRISAEVYNNMDSSSKHASGSGANMWEETTWTDAKANISRTIYRSNWTWSL
jgi:class 3 adenylate cyclase